LYDEGCHAGRDLPPLSVSPLPTALPKDERPLFVTFRTRKPLQLSPEAKTVALQPCLHDNAVTITLHAAVIMPDHVHLLFTARRDAEGWTFALPEILRAIKGASARRINKLLGRQGSVWQDESFDHVLRGNESLRETVEYIRQNPVRKGLVSKPEDYPWLWLAPDLCA
jgi:REP element-mobilizing transposase RayT